MGNFLSEFGPDEPTESQNYNNQNKQLEPNVPLNGHNYNFMVNPLLSGPKLSQSVMGKLKTFVNEINSNRVKEPNNFDRISQQHAQYQDEYLNKNNSQYSTPNQYIRKTRTASNF